MKAYIFNILLALDMFVNSLIPGAKERQTISGRLGIDFDGSIFELGVNWVFYKMGWWGDPFHCDDCAKEEEKIFKIEDNS